jgi:hypothetical protein
MDACLAVFKRGGYNFRLPLSWKKFLVFVQTLTAIQTLKRPFPRFPPVRMPNGADPGTRKLFVVFLVYD